MIETAQTADLKPAPYNPRRIAPKAMAGLEASMERFGIVQPIILNKRSGFVVGGHQRLKALKKKKIKTTPVVIVDLDETDERALNVALNSQSISGEFTDALQAILAQIREADEGLFSSLLLDELLADVPERKLGDPDEVPDTPAEAVTKVGDVYVLGNHRLLCGDCTSPQSFAKLIGGKELVDILLTDPPYGVDYGAKNEFLSEYSKYNPRARGKRIERRIDNDKVAEGGYRKWFASWMTLVPFANPSIFYIFMSSQELHSLREAVDDCQYNWGDYLLWVKNNQVFGRKDYKAKHEFILYGWANTHRFYGDKGANTVLEFDRPAKSELHPTMKPVALLERLLTDGSAPGSIMLDCFGGSGSTMIACESTGRRARMMELDPIYCDVIVKRWETYTGKTANRIEEKNGRHTPTTETSQESPPARSSRRRAAK